MTNKIISVLLLITLGFLGIHRMFLGQPVIGFSYLFGTLISLVLIVLGVGIFGFPVIIMALAVDLWDILKTPNHHFRKNLSDEIDELEGIKK